MNYDLNSILMALQGGQQQPQQAPAAQYMDYLRENNPAGYTAAAGNPRWNNINMQGGMQGPQQGQSAPSWLDAIGHTLNAGNMMQMNPFNQNTMGYMGGGMGQMQPNWWQKGLQGAGSFLQGAAGPTTTAGLAGLSMGLPHALPVAAGGAIGGGLGNLFQYLGQPGQAGIQRDTGAPMPQASQPSWGLSDLSTGSLAARLGYFGGQS